MTASGWRLNEQNNGSSRLLCPVLCIEVQCDVCKIFEWKILWRKLHDVGNLLITSVLMCFSFFLKRISSMISTETNCRLKKPYRLKSKTGRKSQQIGRDLFKRSCQVDVMNITITVKIPAH